MKGVAVLTVSLETTSLIDFGEGSDAVVFLHGWCCRTGDFASQVLSLSDRCRIFVLDWQQRLIARGGDCSFSDICQDIIHAISEAGIERPILCGHSLGGFLAAQLAFDHRMPMRGLLILDSALPITEKTRLLMKDVACRLETGSWEEEYPGIENLFFTESERGEIEQSITRGMMSQPLLYAVGLLDEICSYDEWKSELADINVPIHLVASEHGVVDLEAFHALIPYATSERIKGSGHFVSVFEGEKVNRIMHDFLDRVFDS
jgi:pimeloyl-ACP methyl ester carboxylesterase